MSFFVHPNAICEATAIGGNTRIWAFAHILPDAVLGTDCNICDHVFVENDVVIGNRVTVKCGVQLWDGLRVSDDVFIGPNVTFTNDLFPRSKRRPESYLRTTLEEGCSIGANATVLGGITIGRNAMVGAGAVVTKSVPPNAIVRGNPARICDYTSALPSASARRALQETTRDTGAASKVRGVSLHRLPTFQDIRGSLVAGEVQNELPFRPDRFFLVYNVPSSEVRGEHAHRECHQFLICVNGRVHVVVDDGATRQEIVLDQPDVGIHVQPYVWATQYKYTEDAVLLVFASHRYDNSDYIRDYSTWLELVTANSR